jgi:hypothetical protein
VRKEPKRKAKIISRLFRGQKITVIGTNKGFYKLNVDDRIGWASIDYLVDPASIMDIEYCSGDYALLLPRDIIDEAILNKSGKADKYKKSSGMIDKIELFFSEIKFNSYYHCWVFAGADGNLSYLLAYYKTREDALEVFNKLDKELPLQELNKMKYKYESIYQIVDINKNPYYLYKFDPEKPEKMELFREKAYKTTKKKD